MTKVGVLLLSCALYLCACAGPTSPFGTGTPIADSWKGFFLSKQNSIKIDFLPKHQIWHGKTDFTVTVDDPNGIGNDYRVILFYNNLDVTEKFLDQAKTIISPDRTKVQFTMNDVRILPLRENKIYFGYMRNVESKPVFAQYSPPECSAFKLQPLASTHEFEISPDLKKLVQDESEKEKINPNFLGGLIAQESGFDAKAVSWAKAIGLTQISPQGEVEVVKSFDLWPRYPDINHLSLLQIKILIARGRINGRNEWRLNPSLSVKGGVAYIKFLNDYWRKEENASRLKTLTRAPSSINASSLDFAQAFDGALSTAILASYNSGPARVNFAMQQYGDRWLDESPEMNEARLYVRKVMSYCDYFSQKNEEE